MSQEDLELFQQMMGDVKTITHDTVELKKPTKSPKLNWLSEKRQ